MLQKYWAGSKPHSFVNAQMIDSEFRQGSMHWRAIETELAQPFDRSEADPRALASTK